MYKWTSKDLLTLSRDVLINRELLYYSREGTNYNMIRRQCVVILNPQHHAIQVASGIVYGRLQGLQINRFVKLLSKSKFVDS